MKQTFAVRLSEDQLKTLKQIANTENRSVSAIIRNIINEHISRNPSK